MNETINKEIGKEQVSLFSIHINDKECWYKNTSMLNADGLCKAYTECKNPVLEMQKYGDRIGIDEFAQIEQGDNLDFSISFNEQTGQITIFNGKDIVQKELKHILSQNLPDSAEVLQKDGIKWLVRDFLSTCAQGYDSIKNKLSVCLLNTETNKDLLEKIIHKEVFDFSIVPYVLLNINDDNSCCAHATFCKNGLERFDITEDQLFSDAMTNQERYFSQNLVVEPVYETLRNFGVPISEESNDDQGKVSADKLEGPSPLYYMSNRLAYRGASALLYPSILEMAANQIGSSKLIIIPSSIHELLLLPTNRFDCDPDFLIDFIQTVNDTILSDKDKLSDMAFLYSCGESEITRLKTVSEQQEENALTVIVQEEAE